MDCIKQEDITKLQTDIALLKQYNIILDREISELKNQNRTNTYLLVSTLIGIV